ncbi:MAG: hypothetical protein ACN4GZ_08220 [Acidimicrobiales bacterium]
MGLLDDTPNVLIEQETVSHRRNPLPLMLAVAGLFALAATQWSSGTESAVAPDLTTTTTAPATTSSQPGESEDGDTAPFSFPRISLVSSSVAGDQVAVVPFSASGEVQVLGPITDFELDASGIYMAALLNTGDAAAARPLFVGRVGGGLDRQVAVSASGFAWHDTEPATLAYFDASTPDQPLLRTLDVSSTDAQPSEGLPSIGWLQHFGSWGFTTTRRSFSPGFQVFDQAGGEVFTSDVGTAVGHVPTIGVIATLGQGEHSGIDPSIGDVTPLPMFAGQEVLWSVAAGGPRGTFAVQTTAANFSDHSVLVFNRLNEVVARLRGAPLRQTMTWDPDRTKLVYALDDPTNRTSLIVYDAETGTTIESSFLEDPIYPRTIGIIVE